MNHQENTAPTSSEANAEANWAAIDIVWPLLLILTIVSYLLAEKPDATAFATPVILTIAAIKSLFIGLIFMEIRHTPWWMQGSFILLFCGLSTGLIACLKL